MHPVPDGNNEIISFLQKTNPKKNPMTPDRLRTYTGCEHYSDDEAKEVIGLLTMLATCLIEAGNLKNSHTIDNQIVVNLTSENESDDIDNQQKLAA